MAERALVWGYRGPIFALVACYSTHRMAREGGWRRGVSRLFACHRVGASLDRARFGVPNVLSVVDDGACEDVTVQSSVREKL